MESSRDSSADVEAPVSVSNDRLGREEQATATAEGRAAVESDSAEQDSAAAASAAASPSWHQTLEASRLPFLAIGFTAMAALLFIISDIIINHAIHPASTGAFLLLSLCWLIFKRQGGTSSEESSRRANTLSKEAREELLTYFVFAGPEGERAGQTGTEASRTGDTQQQYQQQPQGKDAAGDSDVLQNSRTSNRSGGGGGGGGSKERSTGGRGWRWMGNGDKNGGEAEAGGQNNQVDADDGDATNDSGSCPAGTAGSSPRPPSSPCPPPPARSDQRFDHGGFGVGCVLSTATTDETAATSGVTRAVRELLEEEKQNYACGREETTRQIEGLDDGRPRISGPPPLGVRDADVEATVEAGGSGATAAAAAASTAAALGSNGAASGVIDDGKVKDAATTPSAIAAVAAAAEETPEAMALATTTPTAQATDRSETETVARNGESVVGRPDSEEWSTDRACIVCFAEYAPGDQLCRLPCRHVYHAECINEWLDRAKVPCCPLCKTDLLLSRSEDMTSSASAGISAALEGVGVTGENAV